MIHKISAPSPLASVAALRDPVEEGFPGGAPDFRRLFEEHARYVWRVLRRMGVPEADVPDVAQEVFMVVRRKLDRIHALGSARAFIYGIAVREASDLRRSARVRHERLTPIPPEEAVPAPQQDDVERAEAATLLKSTLERLDSDKRAVFILYELEELDMREVAEAVDCPLQTAYSRLHAARKAVTAAFERLERGGSR